MIAAHPRAGAGRSMRRSRLLIPHSPQGADLLSQLGYVAPLAEGLYTLLPLAQRVLARISAVVRAELVAQGASELVMPLLQPAELWDAGGPSSGARADGFGPQL